MESEGEKRVRSEREIKREVETRDIIHYFVCCSEQKYTHLYMYMHVYVAYQKVVRQLA